MKIIRILRISGSVTALFIIVAACFNACKPVGNLTSAPTPWQGESYFQSETPIHHADKKNVFIIADATTTVLFDMLAPFYLFHATGQANVYIITKDKTPILIKRDLFVVPQLTFVQADSMKMPADVIVVPALSKRDEHQDTVIINWIKSHYSPQTRLLAICDGAATAAATGLYDGKPLTCHASDYPGLKSHFSKPDWVQNTAVTQSGRLYSTAGVSNAVEGSLTVIRDVFGLATMRQVMAGIAYPAADIKTAHNSIAVTGADKFTVARKIFFRKNKNLALLIDDGVDEFEMACITETLGRSFPAAFSVFKRNSSSVRTKYGLTLVTTTNAAGSAFDEVHVLTPDPAFEVDPYFRNAPVIRYNGLQKEYFIDVCLGRIAEQYGTRFEKFVKISLDYN